MVTVAPASAPDPEEDDPRPSLQELVASVAELLMGMGGDPAAATELLRELVGYFGVTLGYLRRHDHVRRCSILLEEYPPRVDVKDPDPLGEVYFETADPVFAQTEHFTSPIITSGNGRRVSGTGAQRRRGRIRARVRLVHLRSADSAATSRSASWVSPWSARRPGCR